MVHTHNVVWELFTVVHEKRFSWHMRYRALNMRPVHIVSHVRSSQMVIPSKIGMSLGAIYRTLKCKMASYLLIQSWRD